MARAPYRPVEETEALRPVAAPVDTFVTPQAPSRDTSLQDLARSLSGLGGNLGSFVEKRDKEAEEADRLRGQAAFWQSNGAGAAAGVSQGLIPAQASPQFMKGYKETEGEVAGGQLEQKFAAAYDIWEGKTSTDPKAYDQFIGGFLRDNIKTNDPDVLRGLIPRVHQVAANYLQKHIGDASKATMQGYTTALSARGDQAIDDANTTGLATQHGTDYRGVFDRLDAIREEGLKTGATREQLDEKLIDTITANAVTKRDPKLLDFLDRKVPGQDYTWGNTPYGRDARQKTIDTLETMGRKSIADDEKKRREEKTEAKDTVTRETIQAITKAPNEPIPEDLLARGEKVDPDFRVNAIRWRDTIGKGTQTSDNGEMLAVTTDILNGGGVQTVQKAMARGVFKNPEDLTKAYKLAESMTKEGPGLDGILKSGSAKIITDTIKARTAGEKNLMAMFDDGSVTPEGLQATTDFKLQVLAWRQDNPNANVIEQEKALGEIGAGILKRIQQPEVAGPVGYDRTGIGTPNTFDAGVPGKAPTTEAPLAAGATAAPTKPNPFGGRDAPQAPGTPSSGTVSPPAPQAPAPVVPPVPRTQATPEQAGAWFNGLPAETRGAIEMKAAQEKKPLTLKMQELYQRGIERGIIAPPAAPAPTGATGKRSDLRAPDGTPIETASATVDSTERTGRAFQEAVDAPATPDAVRLIGEAFQRAIAGTSKPQGGYSSAALRDDPKAARILDFVAGPESGGNYNAFFGNAGSTKDLSGMSLDQVMSWSGNRGTASSATGRYQFMQATLRGLKDEMGLSGGERFTPKLQDRMAVQLLNRRGYSQWLAGKMSTEQFGNSLAQEWAALPRFDTGRSHYEGDGLNRSLVSVGAVRNALDGGGALPGATQGLRSGLRGLVDRMTGRKPPQQTASSTPGGPSGPGGVYANIPDVDGAGRPGQRQKFLEWNPDPVGNNEANLASVRPELATVIRKAQADNPGLRFVVASGKRDAELQAKAVKWEWSPTSDSEHADGHAADIWVLDGQGQVVFDPTLQAQAGAAMKKAAAQLGTGVRWGGDFKHHKDLPHIELAPTSRA